MSDVRRVSVRGFGGRVDVALPAAVPVAELLPALAALCGAPAGPAGTCALARVGAAALAPAETLAEAGVLDGEALLVVDPARWRPPVVSAGHGRDGPPARAGRWRPGGRAALLAGLGVLAALVGAGVAADTGAIHDGAAVLALVAAAGLLAAAIGLRPGSLTPELGPARTALALCAWIAAGLGAWGVTGPGTPAAVPAGGLAVGVAALVAHDVVPALSPGVALAGTTLAAAAGAVGAGVPPASVGAVVLAVGLVELRLLTPAFGWLLGATTARLDPRLDHAAIARRSRPLRTAMASLSAGLVAVVLGAVPVLLAGGPPALALVLVAALSLLLRAWSYRYLADVLPAAAGAATAALAFGAAVGLRLAADPALVVALLVGTGLALACASGAWPELPSAKTPVRRGWLLVDLLLLPLTLGAVGAFDGIAHLVHHLVPRV